MNACDYTVVIPTRLGTSWSIVINATSGLDAIKEAVKHFKELGVDHLMIDHDNIRSSYFHYPVP